MRSPPAAELVCLVGRRMHLSHSSLYFFLTITSSLKSRLCKQFQEVRIQNKIEMSMDSRKGILLYFASHFLKSYGVITLINGYACPHFIE